MLDAIENELNARERSGIAEVHPPPQADAKPTAATFMSAVQPVCCYCSNSHKSANCHNVSSASARKQILKRAGWCFVCLKRGHLSRECQSAGRCRLCKGHPHSSICDHTVTSGVNKQQVGFNQQNPAVHPSKSSTQPALMKDSAPTVQNPSTPPTVLNPTAPTFASTANLYVSSNQTVYCKLL